VRDVSSAEVAGGPVHSFSDDCRHCGDGRSGTRCDLSGYSARLVKFVLAHRESYEAAYLNPTGHTASNELARLEREYRTLPPRHSCSCAHMNQRTGITEYHCLECKRIGEQIPKQDISPEYSSRQPVRTGTVPMSIMLDLERALTVLGNDRGAHELARYMSLNGTSVAADLDVDERQSVTPPVRAAVLAGAQPRKSAVIAERAVECLMCSRTAVIGEGQCRWCGGSVVVTTVA
jgi:hypothetical protein